MRVPTASSRPPLLLPLLLLLLLHQVGLLGGVLFAAAQPQALIYFPLDGSFGHYFGSCDPKADQLSSTGYWAGGASFTTGSYFGTHAVSVSSAAGAQYAVLGNFSYSTGNQFTAVLWVKFTALNSIALSGATVLYSKVGPTKSEMEFSIMVDKNLKVSAVIQGVGGGRLSAQYGTALSILYWHHI